MNNYDYLDDEFSENTDYCDIHGNPLVLFQADSGAKYVNVEDVRKAGFAIFRRDCFNPLLVDRRQIQMEFELHLLSEAKTYILKNKAVAIDEEHILRTIERCKNKLLGEQPADSNRPMNDTARNQASWNQSTNQSQHDRFMNHTRENDTFARPERIRQQRGGFNSSGNSTPIGQKLTPKALPSKFIPNERYSVTRTGDRQKPRQNNYNNRENNGFDDEKFENRGSFTHKSPLEDNVASGSNRGRSKSRHRDDISDTSSNSDRRKKLSDLESVDKIDTVELESGCYYDMKITHIEKENIFWAHKTDSSVELENMLIQLFDTAPELEDLQSPIRGQLALAVYEDVWCRARVLNESDYFVHFLDYGNRHKAESLKVFPENLRKIPVLGLRFALSKTDVSLATDLELRIMIKKKYEDGTYLVDVEKIITGPDSVEKGEEIKVSVKPANVAQEEEFMSSKPVTQEKLIPPAQEKAGSESQEKPRPVVKEKHEPLKEVTPKTASKVYMEVPKELSKLKNGDKVMLLDVVGNQFATKTKESVQKNKELTEYIKKLDKSNLLMPSVEEGQMVLCCKDGLSSLYRAVVSKKTSDAATVRYLDYPGEEQLSINSLRNVDDFLASQPTCLLRSPEFESLDKLGPKGSEYVFQLLSQKEKVKVVITDDGDFDFRLDDGSLLSEKIEQLDKKEEEPKVQVEDASVSSSENKIKSNSTSANTEEAKPKVAKTVQEEAPCITYDDMDWIKLEVGSTENFLCYTLKDLKDLTLISLGDESIKYMEMITDLIVSDEVPYEPSEFEMIMVAYQAPEDDEPQWYRGVVLEKEENGDYSCQTVDFGNQIVVKSKDIRRFQEHLKNIPILGISCECVGIPYNDAVLNKLRELIPEGEEVTVVVKGFEELKYQIELPNVYKILKEEGLC
ncbi:uncharacterized protein isoform X2 [Leptinotarsa decemlineata]